MANDPATRINDNRELVLPIPESAFADFVTKLLGKPQTIEALFSGPFDLEAKHIEDCFHIVDHRVKQQNSATLVQFIVRIDYDDNSSVTLNSLQEFISYREVRPVTSVAAHLSWIYLIKFQDRTIPEKQTIDLSISTQHNASRFIIDPAFPVVRSTSWRAAFFLRISHTERTWGTDIENLLSGVIRSWKTSEPKFKTLVYENSGWIGFGIGALFFSLTVWGGIEALASIDITFKAGIAKAALGSIEEKLNFILRSLIDSPSKAYLIVYSTLMPIVSLLGSIVVAVAVAMLAENPPQSFLLLSEKAKSARQLALKERIWTWRYFIGTALASTVAGVCSRFIFEFLISKGYAG